MPRARLFQALPVCRSPVASETVPFLSRASTSASDSDLEQGLRDSEHSDDAGQSAGHFSSDAAAYIPIIYWPRRWRLPLARSFKAWRVPLFSTLGAEKAPAAPRRSALRRVFRLLLVSFMILGILHLITLICGLYLSFFPDDLDWPESFPRRRIEYPQHDAGHWPTDITADIHPVGCHSHNDYWRKKPLFSALHAGCTSVEADVWLFDQDLYVGHNTAALTPARTLRTLYIDPLLKILDRQNPSHELHPNLDTPRNGVFDTNPAQNLVLLIDFKGDGEALWPYVYNQLEPLREKKYLTHFNGTTVVEGPVVVVATGNAPFNRIVENANYRDIFFDAPLDLMDKALPVAASDDELEKSPGASTSLNGGQGHSGAAPRNPGAYSTHNSYYASVSFKKAVLGFPTLWHNRLSHAQLEIIRAQIEGAHARGLKVRYWSIPSWPVPLRNYLWRVLVREGVDYLNVDDLRHATRGRWGKHAWGKETGWWFRKS
ncbi:hypothetical protein DV736_g4306, partial [Chaetothyriales sp. CBS 134916]